jgi:TRAP-type mannitol/chloroaromatic compound transport system permease small subunit
MVVQLIDRVNEWIGKVVSVLSLLLVVLICTDVLLRYLFNFSKAALFELEWHLFAALFLLGAAYTLKHDRHVRVDVFYSKFSEKQKSWVNILGTIFFLFPFCGIVAYTSLPFVADSYAMLESSSDAGGLPFRYIIKSCIPIGLFLLLLQGVSELLKSISTLLNKESHV